MAKAKLSQRQSVSSSATNSQDFALVSDFLGYRNKEDKTNLPPGYLIEGSQNVLTTTESRISIRKGYTRDGQADTTIAPILSSYDWQMSNGQERHLRAGSKTGASNGKLQFRYKATAAGQFWNGHTFALNEVFWIDLMTGLTSVDHNYTTFWDTTEVLRQLLFVNGASEINEWSGGVTTFASAAAGPNTITKQGATTWAQEGFLANGTRSININGTTYTYTGGEGTTTLTGVLPNPTLAGHAAGTVIFQVVRTTTNGAMAGIPATLKNALIDTLNNHVYVGALDNNVVYMSKVNNYKDYGFTAPVRLVGEGAQFTLRSSPVAFATQEDTIYVSAGKDEWYQINFTLSADLSGENATVLRLKTGPQQAARSQALVSKIKNSVIYVSNEPTLDELGRVANILGTPQTSNISDPIKVDFDAYNFTDGSVFYFRFFMYVAIPKQGIVRIFNMAKGYWEAPQLLPVSRFAIIDGELYGHSYLTPETFKLFSGYNDNGNVIDARALFSFQNFGTRSQTKYFNELYIEGYISQNTTLTAGIQYEVDGCATNQSYTISGADTQTVCIPRANNALGKVPLGKNPLGGLLNVGAGLPPKFRVIKTFPRLDFYEVQFSFTSIGSDFQWELLAFGPLVERSMFGNNDIKQ